MQKLQGFTQQGNTTLTITGAAGAIARKVEGSFPSAAITVYLAGTLTLASIYSDNLSTPTAKANPFISASDGTFFFYAPNGRYDVKFSGGGLSAPFTLGDFILFDEQSLWVNPIAFGVKGDGTTDDTAAFTAAIAATPVGGTLLIPQPAVSYRISTIIVNKDITIRGLGNANIGQTMFSQLTASAGVSAFQITSSGVMLDNLSITGAVSAGSEADEELACVHITWSGSVAALSNITVQNCYLSSKVAGIFSRNSDATNVFKLTHVKFLNNTIRTLHFGIFIGGYLQSTAISSDIEIADNDIQVTALGGYTGFQNARPMILWNCSGVRIHDNTSIGGFSSYEVISSPATGLAHRKDIQVTDNQGDSHLSFTQVTGGVCSNNIIDMALRDPSWPAYDDPVVVGIYGYLPGIESADITDCAVNGNVVRSSVGAGIDFGATINCGADGNHIYNCGSTLTPPTYANGIGLNYTMVDTIVNNNTVHTSARGGIVQWSTGFAVNRTEINGNVIRACQEHGIHVHNGTDLTINGNKVTNINLAVSTFNGIDFTANAGGNVIGMLTCNSNTIAGDVATTNGGKYGIYQPYIDAASNRLTQFKDNICIRQITQAMLVYGRCSGNWDGNNGFVPLAVLTATHLNLNIGMREVQCDPGAPATLAFIDNGTIGDIVRVRFLQNVALTNAVNRLQLSGNLNITATTGSVFTFECFGDANNVSEAWVEIARMLL